MLEMYKTDDIIVETGVYRMQFIQPSNKSSIGYAESLWNKAIRWERVHHEFVLKRIFIERWLELIAKRMSSHWG